MNTELNYKSYTIKTDRQIPEQNADAIDLFKKFFLNRTDKVLVSQDGRIASKSLADESELDQLLLGHLGTSEVLSFDLIGSYTPSQDNQTKWLCIDIDAGEGHASALQNPLNAVRMIHENCKEHGMPVHIEKSKSGDGYHLWIFFEKPILASTARKIGLFLCPNDALLTDGDTANAGTNKGMEVFPKTVHLSENGTGNAVWLPWYAMANKGGSRFYCFSETGELMPIVEPMADFQVADAIVLGNLESKLVPSNESQKISDKEIKASPLANNTSVSKNEYTQACNEFLKDLDLNLVYGNGFTGKQSKEWLECRDPFSESGDIHPSAGVSDGSGEFIKGTFRTFITDETVPIWNFMVKAQQAENKQDALNQLSEWTQQSIPDCLMPKSEEDQIVQRYNNDYATTIYGGKAVVIWEWTDQNGIRKMECLNYGDFKNVHLDDKVKLKDKNGNLKDCNGGIVWLESKKRRKFKQIIFDPAYTGTEFYNLWKGFAVEPIPGDCSLYLKHIREVICCNNETYYNYVIGWMADLIQNPSRKLGVAIVLKGEEGTGKGTFVNELGKLLGTHYKQISQASQLSGKFNAHLMDCLFLFADESFFAGDRSMDGPLKAIITEENSMYEAKGKNAVSMQSYMRIIMASNNEWIVPAGHGARRYFVLEVSENHANDFPYFQAIKDQMNKGGREALLDYLLNYPLAGVNLREIPKTKALMQQKIHSFTGVAKFWYERLTEGTLLPEHTKWENKVTSENLYEFYREFEKKINTRYIKSASEFGTLLNKLCKSLTKKYLTSQESHERKNHYVFPDLSVCREEFEKYYQSDFEWEADTEEEPFLLAS